MLAATDAASFAIQNLSRIHDENFERHKIRIFLARNYLQEYSPPLEKRAQIVERIMTKGGEAPEIKAINIAPHHRIFDAAIHSVKSSWASVVKGASTSSEPFQHTPTAIAKLQANTTSDSNFLEGLPTLLVNHPSLNEAVTKARHLAFLFIMNGSSRAASKAAQEIYQSSLEAVRSDYAHQITAKHSKEDEQRWTLHRKKIQRYLAELDWCALLLISNSWGTQGCNSLSTIEIHSVIIEARKTRYGSTYHSPQSCHTTLIHRLSSCPNFGV